MKTAEKKRTGRVIFWVCFLLVCFIAAGTLTIWTLSPDMEFMTDSMYALVSTDGAVTEWTTIDSWQQTGANESSAPADTIEYGGVLSEKTAMLSTLNGGDMELRFLAEDGSVVIDSVMLKPQTDEDESVDINALRSNVKYTVQYRCSEGGDYAVNLH
ncbi:MAG: hypothetical protein II388_00030 [Clostridia bacterium]|nr:hypothetical protein [Clostridia bacterium]